MNIETERLIIKPLTLDDARRFSEYRDKEEVAMYQSWDEYPLNKAINRIEYCQKHPFHGQIGNYQFGLYLKENNRLIGDIFIEIDGHTTFTLGYTLDSVYWSKGYASEALKSVFKAMHETYSFKICLCHVYEDNIKSIKLLERNGFDKYPLARLEEKGGNARARAQPDDHFLIGMGDGLSVKRRSAAFGAERRSD